MRGSLHLDLAVLRFQFQEGMEAFLPHLGGDPYLCQKNVVEVPFYFFVVQIYQHFDCVFIVVLDLRLSLELWLIAEYWTFPCMQVNCTFAVDHWEHIYVAGLYYSQYEIEFLLVYLFFIRSVLEVYEYPGGFSSWIFYYLIWEEVDQIACIWCWEFLYSWDVDGVVGGIGLIGDCEMHFLLEDDVVRV